MPTTTARDVLNVLHKAGRAWLNPQTTVDRITHGRSDHPVKRGAVAWMPTRRVIERAAAAGVDLIVAHEPIIWDHHDDDTSTFDPAGAARKRAMLDEAGIAVLRCHDLWDYYPDVGVGPTWARTLGLDDFRQKKYTDGFPVIVCNLNPAMSLENLARHMTARLGDDQPAVAITGPLDLECSRFVVNIGAGGSHGRYLLEARDRFGAQAAAATEFSWWRDASWALDEGFGLIHINHGTSEAPSMRTLHDFLADRIPAVQWQLIHEASPCQWVTTRGVIG